MVKFKWLALLVIISTHIFEIFAETPKFLDSDYVDYSKVFHHKNAEGEFLRYFIVNDSSVSVIGNKNDKYSAKTLTIPSSVVHDGKEYIVRFIQSFAFRGNYKDGGNVKKIEEIILPETLELVGQDCFPRLPSLRHVTIPKSLRNIGYCMFADCPKLEDVIIPYDSQLDTIERFAFNNCEMLKYFHIPANVRYIGEGPWRNCTSLSEINVASMNENYTSDNGVLFSKDKTNLIQYPPGKSEELYVSPNQVSTIGNSAFYGNQFINKVVLSENTKHISHIAFNGCVNLSNVYFPNGLVSIGNGAFWDCPNLNHVILSTKTQISKQQFSDDSYNSFMPKVFIDRSANIFPYGEDKTGASSKIFTNLNLKVDNMVTSPLDITASTNKRYDLNNEACALLVINIPLEGCLFQGNVIGETLYRVNEYWVYMSSGAKYLKIQAPNHPTLMVDFNKYGFTNGVDGLNTYYLSFSSQ